MRIDILSAVPQLLQSPFEYSIVKRARTKGIVDIYVHDLHKWGKGKYKQIDDYPFGGMAGMVLMIEPIFNAINDLKKITNYDEIIFLTPDAPVFNQKIANQLSLKSNLLFICGHYKGIDQRVRDNLVTMELSIGDYVLSGGELAAAIVVDAIVRLLPGAISDAESALSDSFQDNLLSPPVYTRPADFNGWKVPDILLSGNHQEIKKWLYDKALERTKKIRPDLLDNN